MPARNSIREPLRYYDEVLAEKLMAERAQRADYAERLECIDREVRKLYKIKDEAKKADLRFGKLTEELLPVGTLIAYKLQIHRERPCLIVDWNWDHTFCITYDRTQRVKTDATLDRIVRILRTPK